jgi:hypothetical protein
VRLKKWPKLRPNHCLLPDPGDINTFREYHIQENGRNNTGRVFKTVFETTDWREIERYHKKKRELLVETHELFRVIRLESK